MKMMMALLALGGVAAYFFTRNRKLEIELEIEPRQDAMAIIEADMNRSMAAGAE